MQRLNFIEKKMIWQNAIEAITNIPLALKKQIPCPFCGGQDRFVYDDADQDGTWYCRGCGGPAKNGGKGNGFEFIKRSLGVDYAKAVELVMEYDVGAPKTDYTQTKQALQQVFPATLSSPEVGKPLSLISESTGVAYKVTPKLVTTVTNRHSQVVGWVVRYERDGKKVTPQVTQVIKDGINYYCAKGLPSPKPLILDWSLVKTHAVLIVEGEKTRDAAIKIYPDMCVVTWIGGVGGVATADWGSLLLALPSDPEIYIIPDNDAPGHNAAKEIASITGGIIVNFPWDKLPEKWDVADEIPSGLDSNFLYTAISKAAEVSPVVTISESDPIDLLGNIEPPNISPSLLPNVIAKYAMDQAQIIGTDAGIIALSSIVTAAACMDDRITLQPKQHESGWKESARLWGAVIGEPSTKKTPAMARALKPLTKIDSAFAEQSEFDFARYQDDLKQYKKNLKAYPDADEPKKPISKRALVHGTTIEALEGILKDNTRGVCCVYDELAGWFGQMDAYSNGGSSKDRPAWLQLFNGGKRRSDTVSRGSVLIKNWSASIIGAIQPSTLQKIAHKLPEDGLLQRFMIVCAKKPAEGVDRAPVERFVSDYNAMMSSIFEIDWGNRVSIYLSKEADKIKCELFSWVHQLLDCDAITGALACHLGKWEGLFCRLLLVYHICDEWDRIALLGRGDLDIESKVHGHTAQKVKDFMVLYLMPHARYAYSNVLGIDGLSDHVRGLARLILVHDDAIITTRDISRRWREWTKMQDYQQQNTLKILEDSGWISGSDRQVGDKVCKKYAINARLRVIYKDQATKETQRRAKANEMLSKLDRV